MGDYGYGNARVRAMKVRLMGHDNLKWLMTQPDVQSLINTLGNTAYRNDISAALVIRKGIQCLELALQRNLSSTLQRVIDFYEEHARQLLISYLSYWDVFNIKTILRGVAEHTDPEEFLLVIVPVGELNSNLLKMLAQSTSVKEVIDLLATWNIAYAQPLTAAFPDYNQEKRLMVLEAALDRFYYAHTLKLSAGRDANARLVRGVIGREIDKINIITLLRLGTVSQAEREKWHQLYGEKPCTRFLIPGGFEFSIATFQDLPTCPSIQAVVEPLHKLPCYDAVKESLDEYHRSGRLFFFERCLEREHTKLVINLFRGDPLSIAIPLAYIHAKTNEVINIRIIARGVELGLSPEDITKELIIV